MDCRWALWIVRDVKPQLGCRCSSNPRCDGRAAKELRHSDKLDYLVPASVELLAGLIAQSAARQDGHDLLRIAPIPALAATHWQEAGNRDALLLIVLAASVVLTARDPGNLLPVELWRRDLCAAGVNGADLERFFSALGGEPVGATGSLVESAAAAVAVLRRPPTDLRDALRVCFWLRKHWAPPLRGSSPLKFSRHRRRFGLTRSNPKFSAAPRSRTPPR